MANNKQKGGTIPSKSNKRTSGSGKSTVKPGGTIPAKPVGIAIEKKGKGKK